MSTFFVKTSFPEMYEKLKTSGLPYLGKEGDFYCFANDPKLYSVSEEDKNKTLYTNILCLQQ